MFVCLALSLAFASYLYPRVTAAPTDPLVLPALPLSDLNTTDIIYQNTITDLFLNSTWPAGDQYHFNVNYTTLSVHVKFPVKPPPLVLPPSDTLHCLHSFTEQLSLYKKDYYLDRLRYVVFNNVKATFSPAKNDVSNLTFGRAKKVIASLWYFISRQNKFWECRFAVFDNGIMIAWGTLERYKSSFPPLPSEPKPTALE